MFKELEYKFKTDLTEQEVLNKLHKTDQEAIFIEGRDYYFSGKHLDSFVRYRDGSQSKELTFKKKLNGSNKLRTEVDIKLDSKKQFKEINFFLENLEYFYSFNLTKKGFVLELDNHVLSMYTVSTLGKEDETYIEIEINKSLTQSAGEQSERLLEELVERYADLEVIEKENIEKRSLYELCKPIIQTH
jgi:predicted adenylyl cyclase CyaB